MSDELFPALPGLKIEIEKSPQFITRVQRSVSGRELRASYTSAPIWTFRLSYEFLRSAPAYSELQALQGFFLARRGSWDSFLYPDPDDWQAVMEPLGIGDGVTMAFQVKRTYAGVTDPVANIGSVEEGAAMWSDDLSAPMWSDDLSAPMWAPIGYRSTDYTLSAGVMTFNAPPPPGVPIYWSGTYYYRCRFADDGQDYSQFLHGLWQAKRVEFIGSLGTKI